ncbi:BRO family protein [Vibrio rumoiensis]|uniref:BRO family protein n=1 Tax=Vibrio rumoiensis TaxID=76258 RepID=UPI003AA7E035
MPNKNLTEVFNSPKFGKVRVIPGELNSPWFVAADIAEALGYKNTRDAIRKHVDSEDKGVANHDTLGGEQKLTTINESGLYALIFSSKLPSAKEFKRWVTSEVLPSIRKNGGYTYGQESMTAEELLSKALLVAKSTIEQKESDYKRLNHVVNDLTVQFGSGFSIPDFCRQLNGVNIQAVQKSLKDQGLLIRDKSGYKPSGYSRNRYFECQPYEYEKGKFSYTTLVTPKGAAFLYKLYRDNKLPMRQDWNGAYSSNHIALDAGKATTEVVTSQS